MSGVGLVDEVPSVARRAPAGKQDRGRHGGSRSKNRRSPAGHTECQDRVQLAGNGRRVGRPGAAGLGGFAAGRRFPLADGRGRDAADAGRGSGCGGAVLAGCGGDVAQAAFRRSARKGHPQLVFLFVNPATWSREAARYTPQYTFDPERNIGWRGPYLTQPRGEYRIDESKRFSNMYGETGDQAVLDAWGRPLVLQYAARSEDGLLDLRWSRPARTGGSRSTRWQRPRSWTPTAVGDDLYVALALRE